MRKIKLLFAAALSMIAGTGVMAQTAEEYNAALAAINDGGIYRISTEVDGTKYYVTNDGTLTSTQADGGLFIFQKIATGGEYVVEEGVTAVGIQLTSTANKRFTNAPLNNNKAVLEVSNFTTTADSRANWESQVFFLKDGKYAIRSCNTAYAESSWQDAGRTFWTYTVDPVDPEYTYDPAYVWDLEEDEFAEQQYAAKATVQNWPVYVQSAAGLVKDYNKYYSNAKQTTEGSYEALLDGDYTTFFHSCWSNGPDEDHYLQAELSEATQKFEFYYKKRSQNNNNRPTTIIISAGNSADGEFTEVTTIDSGLPTDASVIDYMSSQIDLGAAYKFVRFTITETNNNAENNGHKFFTFSELYFFPGNDAAASVASVYNGFAAKNWYEYTAEDIAQVSAYDMALKSAISTVTVTYELYEADGTTLVASKEVVQKPYSDVEIPASLTGSKFYDYTTEGTIGEEDCTIKVIRTLKEGYVGALADLSNNKAYTITCDRGAMLTNGTTIASTSNSEYSNAQPGQFAIISYEDNYYLYSVADGKFVANNGYLVDQPTNGVLDALQMTPKTVPYFYFYFTTENGENGVNTNGTGALGGIVINSWTTADPGNQYYMVEAADFDPANAITALDAQFHPAYALTYVVKDEAGKTIFTSDPEPTELGATITTLPDAYKRAYYTYNEISVEVTEANTEAVFTATWGGPFEISADFENAHWYDMAMRGTWYVTSDKKANDGAYQTQNANTMGLVEDSYQWAFVGDGYNGFQIFNKAEGATKSFGWTDATATNAGIPTIMANEEGYHAWKIVASTNTSVPANSFCLNVPGTNLYINQYGGAGGSVKFWNSANNVGDPGSAFTVFDVPSNFASFVQDEITPYFEGTYFVLNDEAKAEVGYEPAYTEECPFEAYKSMKEKLTADFLADATNYVLPETGVYFLRNKNYSTIMGIDPSDANMYGNYNAIKDARNYVTLIKTGDATYKIGLMGKFAPATVGQSSQVTATAEAADYTVTIPVAGYAAFSPTPTEQYSYLHCAAGGSVVGWEASAAASQWAVEDAESINLTVGEAGYATAYLPFPVEIGQSLAVPAAKGAWTFDDNTTGSLTATNGVTIADGVATVPVGDRLTMATGVEEISTYSIMFDIMAPVVTGYSCLFNNSLSTDGSFFIKGGQVGLNVAGLKYNGTFNADEWYRVMFVSEDAAVKVYIDGVLVGQSTAADELHWKLGSELYFFADDDGEEKLINVDQLRYWDVALTDDEVAMIGAYGNPDPVSTSVAAYTGVIKDGAEGKIPGDYKYLELNPLEDAIPALTAVVLKAEPGVYEFAIPAVEADEDGNGLKIYYGTDVDGGEALAKEKAEIIEDNDLKGTLEPIPAEGLYVLAKPEGEVIGFYLADEGTIAAGKAYLEVPEGSGIKAIVFADDAATGIANIEKNVEDGRIYNVAGQRLQKMQKGVNIVNGKKILF